MQIFKARHHFLYLEQGFTKFLLVNKFRFPKLINWILPIFFLSLTGYHDERGVFILKNVFDFKIKFFTKYKLL